MVEMELGMALVLGCAAAWLLRLIPPRARALAAIPAIVLMGYQVVAERRFVKRIERPVDVAQSIEYRSAKWLEENLPNRRVMVPGSMAAWLNAFGDSPQLGGQSYSTAPNWMQQVAQFTIFSGDGLGERDAEYSILWLKAFGVAAVGVSGPHSPEYWKPFAHPGKFEGVLPVLWREDDTTIYGVPPAPASLAHAVRPESLVRHKPVSGADVEELRDYVAALDDAGSRASFEWRGPNRAVIRAHMTPEQMIATQVTYDPGWRATANGTPRRVFRDGLGLLVIQADCAGACEIDMDYDGGLEARVCRAVSLAVIILTGAYGLGLFRRLRRRAR